MAEANINHVLQHGTFHEVLAVLSRSQGEANFDLVASAVLMAAFERGKIAMRLELLKHESPNEDAVTLH